MTGTTTWGSYTFQVYQADQTTWNDVAGIYIFAGISPQGYWVPVYVGQADSFANRFSSHEKWPPAHKLGVRHVHTMLVPKQSERNLIEAALIKQLQPQLNTQLK
jgi:excinuclease UvrABC nuclease subunit